MKEKNEKGDLWRRRRRGKKRIPSCPFGPSRSHHHLSELMPTGASAASGPEIKLRAWLRTGPLLALYLVLGGNFHDLASSTGL